MDTKEFERTPVSPSELQPARYFAASYAGEHVAGTEFVIGAMFVSWGVSTHDILWGLLWGNSLAVLSWALICAPIATDTRLTLYAYLAKIAGPGMIKIYSAINGVLFCILAGAMITVSASAVRILFDIPPQVKWYPTNSGFVLVAAAVGAVVASVAALGFRSVARFAEVCAPWMIMMFLVGAMALWPTLVANVTVDSSNVVQTALLVADTHIWRGDGELNVWHVIAFSWICNLAMHGALGDMTLLRFARSARYGYFSALGMFIGHYCAWVCAGVMGAGAALMLNTSVTQLDAGEVAYQALGTAGIFAVVIAGWTTSNPTLYRAGMAFQSLNPAWSRVKVTASTGIATTLIACFPFVFTRLLDFVGIMGLVLAPVGAIIVAEHWLFPRFGLTRYWSNFRGDRINKPAVVAWAAALAAGGLLYLAGLHLFFLLIPVWLLAMLVYVTLAGKLGAKADYSAQHMAEEKASRARQDEEVAYLKRLDLDSPPERRAGRLDGFGNLARIAAAGALIACLCLGIGALLNGDETGVQRWMIVPTVFYFAACIVWIKSSHNVL